MRGIVLAALAALLLIVPAATAAPPDAPTACRVDRPAGLWTRTTSSRHRPVGHAPAPRSELQLEQPHAADRARARGDDLRRLLRPPSTSAANPNQNGANWRVPQSYRDWLEPGLDLFKTASNGRFNLKIDVIPKWFRMSEAEQPSTA